MTYRDPLREPMLEEMLSSNPAATLRDDTFDPSESGRPDDREPIGSFNEYVEAVVAPGARVDFRKLLRDPGTANLYQKYLDLQLSGPRAKASRFPVVDVDRRG